MPVPEAPASPLRPNGAASAPAPPAASMTMPPVAEPRGLGMEGEAWGGASHLFMLPIISLVRNGVMACLRAGRLVYGSSGTTLSSVVGPRFGIFSPIDTSKCSTAALTMAVLIALLVLREAAKTTWYACFRSGHPARKGRPFADRSSFSPKALAVSTPSQLTDMIQLNPSAPHGTPNSPMYRP